jgi:hypothetical protein
MYGLVNKAIEDMVVAKFGVNKWELIKQRANVERDVFISMESYPDDITYRLVGAASEVLDIPQNVMLEDFGRFWVLFTGNTAYGPLLNSAGATIQECLASLDQMHRQVGLALPYLKPPSFYVANSTPESMQVHYLSERKGLAPMVVGLLRGLGELYHQPVTVEHDAKLTTEHSHDVFTLLFV